VAIDRAATLKNAEKLLREGKVEPAIAEYLRLVEDQPRDWNLANTLGDLYVRSGQVDVATELFARMADSLSEAGFLPKASAIYKKVLKLRPDHEHALLRAAEIAAGLGLLADARAYLGQLITHRQARGDKPGVAQARIRLGTLDPADFDSRKQAARVRIEVGDVPGASRDLMDIATALFDKERPGEALETLREAAQVNPDDDDLRAQLARALVARGNLEGASSLVTVETAGDNPRLLFAVAERHLRGDRPEAGLDILRQLLQKHPDRGEEVAFLGWSIAEEAPDQGFAVVELAAETAVAGQDWASAAAALQEFVTRVPNHVAGLMRLVEICVDGGLEATMYSAQAHLADAYIAMGHAGEARFIAEDLVAREPWDRSNLARFRRALELQGEADPEAIIADRLSGKSPFMTTDLLPPSWAGGTERRPRQFDLSASAVDLESILGELDTVSNPADAFAGGVEIDLGIVLDDIEPAQRPTESSDGAPAAGGDIDDLFAQMRDEASRRSPMDEAEQHYQRALVFRAAGDVDGCIAALEMASRAPRLRFATASLLGRIFRDRGMWPQAVEWFEKAAQAPSPTAAEGHELLYDLADTLEREGESARALAIALELQADAGAYRDIAQRINRLITLQGRG
jgi:tetratricopeptide (TPR) repeat protein